MKEKTTKEMIVEAVKGSRNHNHVFERHTEKGIHEWSKKTLNERVLNIINSEIDTLMGTDPESYPTMYYAKSVLLAERLAFETGSHGVFLESIGDAVNRVLSYFQTEDSEKELKKTCRRLEKGCDASIVIKTDGMDAISVKYDGTVATANGIQVVLSVDEKGVFVKTFYPVLLAEM